MGWCFSWRRRYSLGARGTTKFLQNKTIISISLVTNLLFIRIGFRRGFAGAGQVSRRLRRRWPCPQTRLEQVFLQPARSQMTCSSGSCPTNSQLWTSAFVGVFSTNLSKGNVCNRNQQSGNTSDQNKGAFRTCSGGEQKIFYVDFLRPFLDCC